MIPPEVATWSPVAVTTVIGYFVRRHIKRVDCYFEKVHKHETRIAVIEDRCGITGSGVPACEKGDGL